MVFKGTYSGETSYSVGDAVIYTDGVPYHLQAPAVAGTGCYDTRCWERVPSPVAEVFVALNGMLSSMQAAHASIAEVVNSMLFDEKTIILKSSTESSDKVYAITVDDEDGLEATEITEEEVVDGEGGGE